MAAQHASHIFQARRLLTISSAKQFLRACLWILWLPIAEAGRSGPSLLNPLTTGSCPPAVGHIMIQRNGGWGTAALQDFTKNRGRKLVMPCLALTTDACSFVSILDRPLKSLD